MEKDARRKVRLWVTAVFVATLVVGAFGIVIWQTHEVVTAHNQELQRTLQVANEIHSLQVAHQDDLSTIKKDTQLVAGYAQTLENLLNTNHGESYTVLVNLCHQTPGCVVPE